MVSQLFVELSIGGTWWLCWRTGLGLLQFSLLKNIFGDDNYFEETSSLLSPFSHYNYFWILGSFKHLKTGEPNKYKFFMQPLLFLVKLLVETAARKCLISVYGKDYCGDSCNWEIHFSVTTKKRRRIDRRPCSELKVWRSCWSTYLSQRKCILLYRQSCPLHRGVLEGTVFMLQCTI